MRKLVDAHATQREERLVLAVRFQHDDRDVRVLEVLDGWPGENDDPLFSSELGSTSDLVLPGKLHLLLGSPPQVRSALARNDPSLDPIRKDGIVIFPSTEADDIVQALGVRVGARTGQQEAREVFVAPLEPEQRATPEERAALLRSWQPSQPASRSIRERSWRWSAGAQP